jgi:hypothetical protein
MVPGVDHRIVVDDDNSVVRRVHIELDGVGAELDGALEGGERVLGMRLVRSPVGYPFGRVSAPAKGQAFLGVVGLCWMSAKL